MDAMFLLEKNTREGYVPKTDRPLYDAMVDWVELYKKPNLKPQSYRSIRSTVNNQIKKSALQGCSIGRRVEIYSDFY